MGKPAGTHQPLGYRNRVRLNAAIKHLKSPFHAVRVAAHKEIQAILNRKRGIRRLRAWFADRARAGVRKVTPSHLHGPLRVKAGAPQQAPSRGQATPIRANMPKDGFTPLTDHPLTRAELSQRTKAAKVARRSGQPVPQPARPQPARAPAAPARQPDAMQQAQEAMRQVHQRSPLLPPPGQTAAHEFRIPGLLDVIAGEPERTKDKGRLAGLGKRLVHRPARSAAPAAQGRSQQHAAQQSGNGQQPRTDHHGPVRNLYSPDSVLSADDRQARAAAKQARNGQREGRKWGGLHKRLARPAAATPQRTAPDTRLPSERVADNGRTSRARTTA
jgi:hypothetical protein